MELIEVDCRQDSSGRSQKERGKCERPAHIGQNIRIESKWVRKRRERERRAVKTLRDRDANTSQCVDLRLVGT